MSASRLHSAVPFADEPQPIIDADQRLKSIFASLSNGNSDMRVSVREILVWFGAERREPALIEKFEAALTKYSLSTEPNIREAYLDGEIAFLLKKAKAPDSQKLTPVPNVDLIHRVSRLKSANSGVCAVSPDDPLLVATTKMFQNDYSQLPVMSGDRIVKGMISWRSIGKKAVLGVKCEFVRDCIEEAQVINNDRELMEVVPLIAEHDAVLVRDKQNKIVGLISASDISLQFQQLGEPFLLIGEIENHIRAIIQSKFSAKDFEALRPEASSEEKITNASKMNFGDYVRLLANPDGWRKAELNFDRVLFTSELDKVRQIRNQIMHFDSDGVSPRDLSILQNFSRFLQELKNLKGT